MVLSLEFKADKLIICFFDRYDASHVLGRGQDARGQWYIKGTEITVFMELTLLQSEVDIPKNDSVLFGKQWEVWRKVEGDGGVGGCRPLWEGDT